MNDNPTILIVDDALANIEIAQAILGGEGFRTVTAENGADAVRISQTLVPDLILLDVVMPGDGGFEVCAKLKSNSTTAEIPVIFLSALDDVKSKVTGLKIGGVDYVTKPVHGEELLARVRVHLRLRQATSGLAERQRRQLDRLRTAQNSILVRPEDCPEALFDVCYEPLEEAGGDFYDVARIDNDVFAYFVADISGHGVSAAFLTSAVKALLRLYGGPVYSPEDTMRGVDAVMRQLFDGEGYLTACYARLNRRTEQLTVVSAGHPPVVVVRANGSVEMVEMDTEPLGIFSSAVLKRKTLRLSPGDRFFLYTDGVIEKDGARIPGLQKLIESCIRRRNAPLDGLASMVCQDVRPDSQRIMDDALLMVVEGRRS